MGDGWPGGRHGANLRPKRPDPDPHDHAGDRDLIGDDHQVVVDKRGGDQQGEEDRMVTRRHQLRRRDLSPSVDRPADHVNEEGPQEQKPH